MPCGTDAIHQHTPAEIPRQLAFLGPADRQKAGHRAMAQVVPRGGVVNARRPGRRPGRSEAKSIDDAEHGASMKCAMVRQRDLDPQRQRSFRETREPIFVRFIGRFIPADLDTNTSARAARFVVHNLYAQTATCGRPTMA